MATDDENSSPGDDVYKWTIRGLYLAAIALNVWYLALSYANTPEGEQTKTHLEKLKFRIMRPWVERKKFRRAVNETIVEAWIAVDNADKEVNE